MPRRAAILLAFLIALSPVLVLAQDDDDSDDVESGRVFGTVVNGTSDGDDVAGLDVVLTRFQQMDPVEEFTTEVGPDGSYEFEDLPIHDNEAYLAEVEYEGLEFRSGMILLTQEPEAEREITVYEQTDDPSVLRIVSRGIVIAGADEDQGLVEILEIIALENESDRTFVGDENGEVLRLAVPENAAQVSPQAGFDFGQMYFDETTPNVLVSTGPVNPGSHNPMVIYQIPYEGTSGSLSVGTAMPTSTVRVLVEEDTYDISSTVLEPAGQAQVGGDTYEVLAIDSPVIGDTFTVRISGLPRENWILPIGMSTFFASLAAGVGLVIGAVLIYQVVQRRQLAGDGSVPDGDDGRQDMALADLEQERLELASELNKLEADFERGDIDEETYSAERDHLVGQLREISLRMRGFES